MNRTIIEKVRCMLFDANLGKQYWAEAASTAAFLINRTPCRNMTDTTPEEIWSKVKPDLSALRVFGCKAMVHVPKENRRKLDSKSVKCIFLGYSEQSKAYKLYNPRTRQTIVSRDVTFFENINKKANETRDVTTFPSQIPQKPNRQDKKLICSSDDSSSDDSSDDDDGDFDNKMSAHSEGYNHFKGQGYTTELDKTQCEDNTPREQQNDVTNESNVEFSEGNDNVLDGNSPNDSCDHEDLEVKISEISTVCISDDEENLRRESDVTPLGLLAATSDVSEPKSVREALNGANSSDWTNAMLDEYNALMENGTWVLTDLPPGRKAIDSKWVFKVKRNAEGDIDRFKARLVVKGYSQVRGIDYDETYSPVVRYSSVRFLLAMAVKLDLVVHQMDAVTAFLQGELQEELYISQPQCFDDKTGRVCRLRKSLYGLKQSSRVWNLKLNSVLTQQLGFKRSAVDQCIYYKHSAQNVLILTVYVDDILIFGSNSTMITKLKKDLSSKFKMKDMGVATSVLGMHIVRNNDKSISIDQKQYLMSILERFNMSDSHPVNTPLDPNQRLSKDMCPKNYAERQEMGSVPYQEAIGCIMYAAQISRPDIAYAVSVLSRYNTNHGKSHWSAVKRVLRYLKGTIDLKLTYRKDTKGQVVGYCDADWAGDQDERRSTTGYVFQLQGAAISWATRRQPTIALSSTEAEFMSMVAAIQEALWLKRFECEIFPMAPKSMELYCDNQGAIQLAMNSNYQARTKHIDVKNYFIREKLAEGTIKLSYRSTDEMVADIMTKPVNHSKLSHFISHYGLN